MDIQKLMEKQLAELGQKWLACISNPLLAPNMTNVVCDHFLESMKECYRLGLQTHNKQKIKKHLSKAS